jgi:hypothetical protein
MSNRASIQRTVFVNHHDNSKSFGYRMYDDEGQTYCNTLEEADLDLPDPQFLEKAAENFDEVADTIFEFAIGNGIFIDEEWYRLTAKGDGWELLAAGGEDETTRRDEKNGLYGGQVDDAN